MALLTCKNLCVGYVNKEVLHNLNLEIQEGDYLCVIGKNGTGKTSLFRTILGLECPISGDVLTGDGLKRNEIGYLPQQTSIQKDFPASVWEIVLSGFQGQCGFRPFYSDAEKRLALENMERMEITNLKKSCYRELSGGQQQRVLLARALCATKKILFLDEPVSGLDPNTAEQMYLLIKKLNDEGITIAMISHDIAATKLYASHILSLGSRVFFGTKDDYLSMENGNGTV